MDRLRDLSWEGACFFREDKLLCLENWENLSCRCVLFHPGKPGLLLILSNKIGKCEIVQRNVKRSEQMKDLHTLPFAEFAFPTHLALSLGLVLSYPTILSCMFCVFRGSDAYCMQLKTKNCFLNRHMNHRLWKVLLYCGRKVCFLKMIIFVIFSFKICMKACLLQISGYKQLYLDVESVRKSRWFW